MYKNAGKPCGLTHGVRVSKCWGVTKVALNKHVLLKLLYANNLSVLLIYNVECVIYVMYLFCSTMGSNPKMGLAVPWPVVVAMVEDRRCE